jgi:hypothetical protein
MPAGPDSSLGRRFLDRLDSGGRISGEEGLGIEGESHPALLARVVPLRDLQRPLDALTISLPPLLWRPRRPPLFRLLQPGNLNHFCYNSITNA